MPRVPFIPNPTNPYHLSARVNNRDWFAIPIDQVWSIMSRFLFLLHHAYEIRIHSFVLMANHFHLLATFPRANVAEAMQYFMRETSRCIAFESGRINHVYGGRYFRSEIRSYHHFMHVYKYIYRNPVEAGACVSPVEYPYSTLSGLIGKRHILIPVAEDTLLFDDGNFEDTLSWLNRAPQPEHREILRRALRRNVFMIARNKSGHEHQLEWQQY